MVVAAAGDSSIILAAMSSGTTILVALIGAGLLKRKGFFKSVASIERGVNHVGPDEPPLIEQVRIIKRSLDETRQVLVAQTKWVGDGMTKIAHQVGVKLSDPPVAVYHDHEDVTQRASHQEAS